MALGEVISGVIGGIGSLGRSIYDLWSNERDFDYQKSLQQDIFNREDTAVQRRMVDLKAAGLNPNLAAGSAAGAGAVVGRSNTPGISGNAIGTALDMASHVQQLREQRLKNQILKNEKAISDSNVGNARLLNLFDRAALYQQLGVKDMKLLSDQFGNMRLWSNSFVPGKNGYIEIDLNDSPLMKQLDWQVQNNKNSAYLLQKDADWYNANQVLNAIGGAARSVAGFGNAYYNFNRR